MDIANDLMNNPRNQEATRKKWNMDKCKELDAFVKQTNESHDRRPHTFYMRMVEFYDDKVKDFLNLEKDLAEVKKALNATWEFRACNLFMDADGSLSIAGSSATERSSLPAIASGIHAEKMRSLASDRICTSCVQTFERSSPTIGENGSNPAPGAMR